MLIYYTVNNIWKPTTQLSSGLSRAMAPSKLPVVQSSTLSLEPFICYVILDQLQGIRIVSTIRRGRPHVQEIAVWAAKLLECRSRLHKGACCRYPQCACECLRKCATTSGKRGATHTNKHAASNGRTSFCRLVFVFSGAPTYACYRAVKTRRMPGVLQQLMGMA